MIMIQSRSYETKDKIETNKQTSERSVCLCLSVYLFILWYSTKAPPVPAATATAAKVASL